MKKRSTLTALLTSALALVICVSMLVGTTFAWFTDSAASANNKIVAGTLNVELWQHTAEGSKNISDSHDAVFTDDIIWEPGMTQTVYFSIKNAGNLDLKYRVILNVTDVSYHSLTDVMVYSIIEDAKVGDVTAWSNDDAVSVIPGENATQANDVPLYYNENTQTGDEHFFALSIHMLESATNEYMGETLSFDIKVDAGQLMSEEDGFGKNDYDKLADYNGTGIAGKLEAGETAVEIEAKNDQGYKIGSANIPADAVDPAADVYKLNIKEAYYDTTIAVNTAAGEELKKFDVSIEGLKEGNTTPVKVTLRIPANLDPSQVLVYHIVDGQNVLMLSSYNPNTGYVTFESASFSPYAVKYNAEAEYQAPAVDPNGKPTASVTAAPQFVGQSLAWGKYGDWSPNEKVDADPKLEAAYIFACTETVEEAKKNPYANWYCDFYVMLNEDLGENEIFLGGNYGSFGWVGFHNRDVVLDANTEIGLLESVTTNPWTYLDVVQNVGTFICGVGDVEDALSGATFTVMLRLTNPANSADYINVATINYTFQ